MSMIASTLLDPDGIPIVILQIEYSPRRTDDVGLTDGETVER